MMGSTGAIFSCDDRAPGNSIWFPVTFMLVRALADSVAEHVISLSSGISYGNVMI